MSADAMRGPLHESSGNRAQTPVPVWFPGRSPRHSWSARPSRRSCRRLPSPDSSATRSPAPRWPAPTTAARSSSPRLLWSTSSRVGDVITYGAASASGGTGGYRLDRRNRPGRVRPPRVATKGTRTRPATRGGSRSRPRTGARRGRRADVGYAFAALWIREVRMALIGIPVPLIAIAMLARLWRDAGATPPPRATAVRPGDRGESVSLRSHIIRALAATAARSRLRRSTAGTRLSTPPSPPRSRTRATVHRCARRPNGCGSPRAPTRHRPRQP